MKVSHEVPICLLDASREFNSFDYCLVHLLETHPAYRNYYLNANSLYNREVLLDCSIFELGKAFDSKQYKEWVEALKPNCYIVPDVLEDAEATMKGYLKWVATFGKDGNASTIRKIGVVQGKTFQELVDCYKFMSERAEQIAISFDYSYYKITGIGKTDLEKNMTGRQRFIIDLIREGVWNWRKPIHLLGCSLAREFKFYLDNNIYNIRSCDTSNPVVAGIEGYRYDEELGLNTKSKTKLADLIDVELTPEQRDLVMFNVSQFKKIISRD